MNRNPHPEIATFDLDGAFSPVQFRSVQVGDKYYLSIISVLWLGAAKSMYY